MVYYPDETRQSDGTTLFSGEGPRVQLPRARPVVNLPTTSSTGFTGHFPAESHYAAATEPSVESLNNQFPYPGAPSPQVNMPLYAQRQVQYPLNESQQTAADGIETRMRGMILRNEIPQGHNTHQETWGRVQNPNQSNFRRPNQAQRHQTFHPNNPPSSNPSFNVQRQLYNPNGGQSRQNKHLQGYSPKVSVQDQIAYLDTLAIHEVPKIEISREEYDHKQALRFSLEATCREVVAAYEVVKDANFKADTVELKCFGSLSTTFATKSSDMDLVLVSPRSKPVLSSPESEIPRLVEKALLDCGYGARLLTKTRVPIIRFCERPAPDLANLLREERLKWETEINAGATRPKAKKKSSKKKTDSGSSEPTKAQLLANSVHAEGEDASRVVSLSAKGIKDATPSTLQPGSGSKKNGPNREGNSSGPMGKQRDDITLLDKSDEELIGLYKLAMQEGWYEPSERNIINTFIKTTQNGKCPEQDKIRARAQLHDLPNIIGRYRAPPEPHRLEFPKDGVGIQCDINFSNLLALHNSHLLRCYSLCDPRVRRMVLFVKAWSKKRKINSPYHGTLSSYGYVLMVLHYLVNIAQPPVVPNLQTMSQAFEDQLSMKEAVLDGHNILFFRNETAIEELRRRKSITSNGESLGSLLRGFFYYYAQTGYNSPAGGFQWTQDTLSLRTVGGILPKQLKGWTGAKTETVDVSGPGPHQTKEIRQRYLFAIEDPFEIEHNIARTVVHNGIVAIREEFRRALRLIENGGMMPGKREEGLFTEAEDKENLQYRAFGPRPRKVHGPSQERTKEGNAANVLSGSGNAQGLGSKG
ncbi:hypothetical protein JMJ35_008932 [Cladonia borealis]|uniref:polynucleotide adenylyltransferase n=1 Tax=Cladonia borealis TaxID=184061 RepID=A0AA39QVK1_9LECA|nr:hypothetical protein JMJ35_008932 [Cladonia borealis]